jgi:hypothetical protein
VVLLTATAADTDGAYDFAVAFQRNAARENHDLAIVGRVNTEDRSAARPPPAGSSACRSLSIVVAPRLQLLQRTVDGVMRDPLTEREARICRIPKMPAETYP